MTPSALGNYFRAFLVKLNMIECQLGHLDWGGELLARCASGALTRLTRRRLVCHRDGVGRGQGTHRNGAKGGTHDPQSAQVC
jgi:hypothetical protein